MSLVSMLLFAFLLTLAVALVLARAWWLARARQQVLDQHLQASEAQYRQLLGVADLAIAVLDEACHVVDWSPVLEDLYGVRREAALGRQFFALCAPQDEAASLSARMMAMRASDAVLEFHFDIACSGSAPRHFRWRARHFTDARDGRRYLSVVGHDVTDLDDMQHSLADSEIRFRQMFEGVPASLALLDANGRVLMANPACARFFGYDAPEQMVMLNIQELVHEDDRAIGTVALTSLMAGHETLVQLEKRYLRRDGVERWGNVRCVRLALGPGQQFLLAQISDVHDRKQTELALMESERRLSTLMANLSGAVYRYELQEMEGGVHHDRPAAFLSEGVEPLTGFAATHYLRHVSPQRLGILIEPEDRPALVDALQAAMVGDGRFVVCYRLRHGVAGMRWISEHGRLWQRPDGSWMVDGHLTDISAERQAREAEQVYRTLVADTHTGFVSMTPEGRVLESNAPFCTMIGQASPASVMGRSLLAYMPPGRENQLQRFLARVLRDGVLRDVEFTFPQADGSQTTLLTNAVISTQGDQTIVKCLVFDISRARRNEQAQRDSERRYRSLFDTSPNGICFMSLEGRVEVVNAAFARLLRQPAGEQQFTGRDIAELTPPEWQAADAAARAQILARGWCDTYRKELIGDDGLRVPVAVNAWLVYDDQGHPLRIMSTLQDVTELAQMERQRDALQDGLRQAQKMEAVGQLAGGIAHDFNNILASILGFAELAQRQTVPPDSKLPRYLSEIHTAGERARDLIRQLLLFSRAGRNDSRVQALSPLVQETARMLRPTLPSSLRLRTFVSQDLPPVRVDAIGLQQVIMNLVINARDACDGHGDVQVLARLAEVRTQRCASCHGGFSGQWVEVAVRDSGHGIALEVIERMFDPFFTTKSVGKGTGMGLSVVHGVVHELGGHLLVETGVDGTLFRVLLPALEALAEHPPLPQVKDLPQGNSERLLVVDDDQAVASMLGELLTAAGYQPLVFSDSTKAAMMLEDVATPIAAMITDQVMPGLEGGELIGLARRYRPGLPVIILSAQAAFLNSDDDSPLLAKPVQSEQLLLAVHEVLTRSIWQSDLQAIDEAFVEDAP
ncbi:MAG: PAS domain S-box protein [Moraxellaceae bacterium]|nr:PAS domain S-box protein [Moraxellaceae bacterium]